MRLNLLLASLLALFAVTDASTLTDQCAGCDLF